MFRKLAWKKPQQVKGTKIVVGGERDGINTERVCNNTSILGTSRG